MMRLCRFHNARSQDRTGLLLDDKVLLDMTSAGVEELAQLLDSDDLDQQLSLLLEQSLPAYKLAEVQLISPLENQEVWAAGVTYLRSRTARMEESNFSASAYDRVYEATRPELFFKSLPGKVVPNGEPVGIRKDAHWSVPEPELALVINAHGRVAGYTIGNDMSARDIEGENLLYLPQAKIYHRSCAVGPWITVGVSEEEARAWTIQLEIQRDGQPVFSGETSVAQIKRSFGELAEHLFRSQSFPHGAVLLTGTGIVPPDAFTLRPRDLVRITISDIGTLTNPVVEV